MEKYIGKKLEGRYEIHELVGFGGMAIVFKAYDLLENRYVAIKILKDEFLESDDFKRRFRNESKAIALLSHPSIVKVFDVNFSDNIQYIVMEYIDGITLKEYIKQQGVVKWKEAVHFTVQILRALQHAHDNGIVHRDIKPQNVMLLEDGSIKVMDFGIARFARENGKTMSDKAIGSVHYISPEQAKGDITDEKTDIYSVGVMLYEMLTGKVPFDGDTPVSIAIKQMQLDPPIPSTINPDIPTGLEEIIMRAMQKEPLLRYQSAAEMLKDIDEFKQNPSVVFEYKYFNSDGTTKYFDKAQLTNKNSSTNKKGKKDKSYTINILAGVAAACVLLATIALFFFIRGVNNKTEDYVLLEYIGKTVEEAQAMSPQVKIVVKEEAPSTEYDRGQIIEQEPKSGITVKVNSEVKVTVSSGLESNVMPDLVNATVSSAKKTLNDMGITDIEVANKVDSSIAVGRVIMSDPAADSEIKKGDKVILYVSAGSVNLPVTVPNLIGRTEVEATNTLSKEGLVIGDVTLVDSSEKRGTVVWQSKDYGTKAKKGERIDIHISNGNEWASEKYVDVLIAFPAGVADHTFVFDIQINGESLQFIDTNPYMDSWLSIQLTLSSGLINGKINSLGNNLNQMVILVNSVDNPNKFETFAEYTLSFDEGQANVIKSPDFELLAE